MALLERLGKGDRRIELCEACGGVCDAACLSARLRSETREKALRSGWRIA